MKKVNYDAKLEHDFIKNYKVLQTFFDKRQITKVRLRRWPNSTSVRCFKHQAPLVFPVSASQARVNPALRAQDHMAPQSHKRAGRSLAAQRKHAAAPRMPPSTFAHAASTLTWCANSTWTCQNFAVPSRLTTWNSSSGSSATLTCTSAGTSTMPLNAVAARALSPSRKMTRATSLPPRWLPSRMALFASPRPHPPAALPPLPTKRQLHQVLCLLCAAVLC